ncbi:tyrosine-protein phosphatase [Parahaliea mediterranea]|uniref:Tyrosine-protein phosphatase n=1 Tax=Parahaliea mediterranea TaxID=651086 RepID=A0A939ILZ4_9GAMM|nr:tyrosine-protein phosphatase [Parahaliea mediterranea]
MKKPILWAGFAAALLLFSAIQFVPSTPVAVPAALPEAQRADHRVLGFEGIDNFRDLGGYRTEDGKQVRWGRLYRSGALDEASRWDLDQLQRLDLALLIDFRSRQEKAEAPDKLPEPPGFQVLEIPTLDAGNSAMVGEVMARIDSGNFDGFDPDALMVEANRQFATTFTPQFRQFVRGVLQAGGKPVLWHCTAGKDRTGYAAAILLRLLGVPREQIMADYMASREPALEAHGRDLLMLRLFKGEEAADNIRVIMGVEAHWLEAAFAAIDEHWGGFDNYARDGLELAPADIAALKAQLLY